MESSNDRAVMFAVRVLAMLVVSCIRLFPAATFCRRPHNKMLRDFSLPDFYICMTLTRHVLHCGVGKEAKTGQSRQKAIETTAETTIVVPVMSSTIVVPVVACGSKCLQLPSCLCAHFYVLCM